VKIKHSVLWVAWVILCGPSLVSAQSNPDSSAWYRQIAINGMVSGSTTYNFNHPVERKNQFRIFDVDANSMLLDLFELTIRQDAAFGRAGFRLDLDAGPYIPGIIQSAGFSIGGLDVSQAYLTYNAPIGSGLKIDVGKFITPAGYEYIERFDGANDNFSHSFLFGYAIPFTHTGGRISYAFTDNISAMAMLVNGWDNSVDNNKGKTGGVQLTWTPVAPTTVAVAYIIGPEQPFTHTYDRSLLDVAATVKLSDRFLLGISGDLGSENILHNFLPHEQSSDPNLVDQMKWDGIAGYLRTTISDAFALILRGEVFDDPQGFRTGAAQTLHEYTLTPEWKPTERLIVRSDIRYDVSTVAVFDNDGTPKATQFTAALNALYFF
jgi:hypothetical protein